MILKIFRKLLVHFFSKKKKGVLKNQMPSVLKGPVGTDVGDFGCRGRCIVQDPTWRLMPRMAQGFNKSHLRVSTG